MEFRLHGVNQCRSTRAPASPSGCAALDPALDPDVVMVGEIRDGETAKISIEAALTGHLVLRPSTATMLPA